MEKFLITFGLVFAVFFGSFLLINIRQLFTGSAFRGTCAQNNPLLRKQIGDCQICGKKADEVCKMPEVKAN
ncbi:MAG: hypothetical protein GY810_28100 [Aureispira sp.]|nr:hypothetical protein [Aureispira sp.]